MSDTRINDGGPAFPLIGTGEDGCPIENHGLSVRDYFAAKAMQGIVSSIDGEDNYERLRHHALVYELKVSQWIAREAYKQADAMLAAREKGGDS